MQWYRLVLSVPSGVGACRGRSIEPSHATGGGLARYGFFPLRPETLELLSDGRYCESPVSMVPASRLPRNLSSTVRLLVSDSCQALVLLTGSIALPEVSQATVQLFNRNTGSSSKFPLLLGRRIRPERMVVNPASHWVQFLIVGSFLLSLR